MTHKSNAQEEIKLKLADVNKQLLLSAYEGLATYNAENAILLNDYLQDQADHTFRKLQHDLLDAYPAILNVQIRDLFTPKGKSNGRFRLHQLGEVYTTLARLLSTISLSSLWVLAMDMTEDNGFKLTNQSLDLLNSFVFIEKRPKDYKTDHLQIVRSICNFFVKKHADIYVAELLTFSKQLGRNNKSQAAYLFFEKEFCPKLIANNIPDNEVQEQCVVAEKHLGQLLKATAFLSNYEIIRIKDITVDHPSRKDAPYFIHEKAHISGREYATVDESPVAFSNTFNNHSIFLTSNIEEHGFSLNLSPFIVDQNAFRGKKNYLPKVYFFDGIDKDRQLHYLHVDTPSLSFDSERIVLANTGTKLNNPKTVLRNSIEEFCLDVGL